MKKRIMTAVLISSLLLGGCGNAVTDSGSGADRAEQIADEPGFERSDTGLDGGFKKAAGDLTVGLFRQACAGELQKGENVLISPASVMMALGLAANGAGGETLSEFEALFCNMRLYEINKGLNVLISNTAKDGTVKIANSIWVNETSGVKFRPDYTDKCRGLLNAEGFLMPFDDAAVGKLNDYVNEKTDGMIPKLREKFEPGEVADLINCIAFSADWQSPYSEKDIIENGTFTAGSGEEQKCTMLRSKEHLYLGDKLGEGFVRLYEGGRYGFAAMLPNEGVSLEELSECFRQDSFGKMTASEEYGVYDISVRLPEFSFDKSLTLGGALQEMGLKQAFTGAADFSNMAENSDICISEVLHKTHITVDRSGTKAAAVTDVIMTKGAVSANNVKSITLDRPFIFAVIDMETQLPLFIGAVNKLS